ncbi:MAG: gamma carbonic anhydrase family protein, partial [Synergistetes bacterium]|nr:gamma carbonic anhydrase family protein [Synergistota bacterium]
IGKYSNVQDLTVIHVDTDIPTIVGDYVTIGHSAVIHGCKIGNYTLVGMGAVVLTSAEIGEGSVIGAGAVIKENEKIPPRSLVVGVPGKVVKTLSDESMEKLKEHAIRYYELSATFL